MIAFFLNTLPKFSSPVSDFPEGIYYIKKQNKYSKMGRIFANP